MENLANLFLTSEFLNDIDEEKEKEMNHFVDFYNRVIHGTTVADVPVLEIEKLKKFIDLCEEKASNFDEFSVAMDRLSDSFNRITQLKRRRYCI